MSMSVREAANDYVAAELRAELGRQRISMSELARRMDVELSWLHKRLTGVIPLRFGEVFEIADLLEISIDRFFEAAKQAGISAARRGLEFAVFNPSAIFRRLPFRYAAA